MLDFILPYTCEIFVLLFFICPPNFSEIVLSFHSAFVIFISAHCIVFPIQGARSVSNWILCEALNDCSRVQLKEWRQPQGLHQHKWHSPAKIVALSLWSWLLEEEVLPAALDCRKTVKNNQLQNCNWIQKDLCRLCKWAESRS